MSIMEKFLVQLDAKYDAGLSLLQVMNGEIGSLKQKLDDTNQEQYNLRSEISSLKRQIDEKQNVTKQDILKEISALKESQHISQQAVITSAEISPNHTNSKNNQPVPLSSLTPEIRVVHPGVSYDPIEITTVTEDGFSHQNVQTSTITQQETYSGFSAKSSESDTNQDSTYNEPTTGESTYNIISSDII